MRKYRRTSGFLFPYGGGRKYKLYKHGKRATLRYNPITGEDRVHLTRRKRFIFF